ncbi:hypothetical protein RJZ56_005617 [Blastomyces dermatitidis]
MSYFKLPVELVEQIAQYMDKEGLKIFGNTSRKTRYAVEPILYEAISLICPATAYRDVLKLLIAIHERPRMVSRTKTLNISEPKENACDERELVQTAGLDAQLTVNQTISHLLSKLPNLSSFHLRSPRSNCFGRNRADRGPLNLSHLRKLVTLHLPVHYLLACLSPLVLPATLERLHVKDGDRVDREHLTELLIYYVKQKPVEGTDTWALNFISIDYFMFRIDELTTICKAKGVKLELKQNERDMPCGREPWAW